MKKRINIYIILLLVEFLYSFWQQYQKWFSELQLNMEQFHIAETLRLSAAFLNYRSFTSILLCFIIIMYLQQKQNQNISYSNKSNNSSNNISCNLMAILQQKQLIANRNAPRCSIGKTAT